MRLNPKCLPDYLCVCVCVLGLSLEQVDILWHCLVEDSECYDDALHWFLNQVRSKDQHAMGMETYKHLFLEKVGSLERQHDDTLFYAKKRNIRFMSGRKRKKGEKKKGGNVKYYLGEHAGLVVSTFVLGWNPAASVCV